MLIALRDYLKVMKRASLKDVALRFDIPESAAEDMLKYWTNKGCIKTVEGDGPSCAQHACNGCHQNCCEATASSSIHLLYQWVG